MTSSPNQGHQRHLAKGSKKPDPVKDKIRLYSNRFYPHSQRIHLILDAKKLQYDVVFISLKSKPDWFLKLSPQGKIPALELENGEVLWESVIIAQYLDEKYPQNSLIPSDPLKKAQDLLLIENFNTIIKAMNFVLDSFALELDRHEMTIENGLHMFDKELSKRGAYFGGPRPGIVDYMIWPWVERADLLKLFQTKMSRSIRKENYKNIQIWQTHMLEDEAVKQSYLDTETHIAFLQTSRSGLPDYDVHIWKNH